jgi:type II secretory pathway component HofQ
MVDANFDRRPLAEALHELADQSGINVVLDARAGEKARTEVTATLSHVPVDTAVQVLADMADLKSMAIDNVIYVTSKANAKTLQRELEHQRTGE